MVIKLRTIRQELSERSDMITALRSSPKSKVMEEVDKIAKTEKHIPISNITELVDSFFVCAVLVTQRLDKKRRDSQEL